MPDPSDTPESPPPAQHTPAEALNRLTDDLRDERERRGVALAEVHEQTRIPLDVLRQFEANGLRESAMFNQVYLRSLVRSYAFAVGLPARALTEVFDEAAHGRYDQTWITRAAASIDADLEKRLLREQAEQERAAKEERKQAEREERQRRQSEEREAEIAREAADEEERERLLASERAQAEERRREQAAASAAASGASWETRTGRAGDRPAAARASGSDVPWGVVAGVALLLLVAAGGAWWFFADDDQPEAVAQVEQAAPDPEPVAPPPPSPDDIDLPAQLTLTVEADGAPIQNLKIRRDEDVRRPYWIEIGEARDFPFETEATLCLSDACQPLPEFIVLRVQGAPFPRNPDGTTVVSRDAVRQALASAQADGAAPIATPPPAAPDA